MIKEDNKEQPDNKENLELKILGFLKQSEEKLSTLKKKSQSKQEKKRKK